MNILVTIIVSAIVSLILTEIRCRIHFDCIDEMVKETLQHMKKACEEIQDLIKARTHH